MTVYKRSRPEGARRCRLPGRWNSLTRLGGRQRVHLALTPSADFGGNAKRLTVFSKRKPSASRRTRASRVFSVAEGMVREAKNGPAAVPVRRSTH